MSYFSPRDVLLVAEEIADLKAILDGLPSALADAEAFAPYRSRLFGLEEELYYASVLDAAAQEGRIIDLRFTKLRQETTSVSANFLGSFLQSWQQFYDSVGQAVLGIPTKRGVIPQHVLRQTALEVQALPAGSFAVRMKFAAPWKERSQQIPLSNELGESNLPCDVFARIESLFSSSRDEAQLAEMARSLKSRVASNYSRILQLLDDGDINLTSAFVSKPHERIVHYAKLPVEVCKVARRTIEKISNVDVATLTFEGKLTGASLRTGMFEIDLGDDGTIAGKVDPEKPGLLKGVELGKCGRFIVLEKTETHVVTGESSVSHILSAFEGI